MEAMRMKYGFTDGIGSPSPNRKARRAQAARERSAKTTAPVLSGPLNDQAGGEATSGGRCCSSRNSTLPFPPHQGGCTMTDQNVSLNATRQQTDSSARDRPPEPAEHPSLGRI